MEIKNCRFLKFFHINAIVLYPFILYRDRQPHSDITAHEEVHIAQIRRDGVLTFYTKYLFEYLQGRRKGMSHYQAYRNISYEKEAFNSARAT